MATALSSQQHGGDEDGACQICKLDRYLRPDIKILVSLCYHRMFVFCAASFSSSSCNGQSYVTMCSLCILRHYDELVVYISNVDDILIIIFFAPFQVLELHRACVSPWIGAMSGVPKANPQD